MYLMTEYHALERFVYCRPSTGIRALIFRSLSSALRFAGVHQVVDDTTPANSSTFAVEETAETLDY
jgi:hypothetical protein